MSLATECVYRTAAALLILAVPSTAQQLLQTYDGSLTEYLEAQSTTVQLGLPTHDFRASGVGGHAHAGNPGGGPFVANPFGDEWDGTQWVGEVNLARGSYSPTEIDISLPSPGLGWVIGRTYNHMQGGTGGHHDSNGYQGVNWFQISQPEILLHDSPSGAANDLIYLHWGGDRFYEYKRDSTGSDEFHGINGASGAFQYVAPSGSDPETFTLTDMAGNTFVFIGFDANASDAAGQLWKKSDPDGNTAYVYHATSLADAATYGWDPGGLVLTAYDAVGREYTYGYTTYEGDKRLTSVEVEVGATLIAKVDYDYYEAAEMYGGKGDLKWVKVTTPLTDATVQHEQTKYYRYYEGAYDAGDNPGYPHCIEYVYGYEGIRRYGASFESASESGIEPYASVHLEYDTSYRVSSAWFDGQCGCGTSGDGGHSVEYDENDDYTDSAGYTTGWHTRTIVERPNGSYLTQYFDEVNQPLHAVISDIHPGGTSPDYWVTKVTRNSSGVVTEISTPANVTGYTHDDSSSGWEITTSTSVGLVLLYARVATGNMAGFLKERRHHEGTVAVGSADLDEILTYSSGTLSVGDVTLVQPRIASRRVYHEDGKTSGTAGSTLTQYDYEVYSGTLSVEEVKTTLPAVSTANNGSGTSNEIYVHYDESGRVDYEKSAGGIITYREYTDGQLTKVIRDADTTSLSEPDGFTSFGTPLNEVTEYSHDAQGRLDETTLPGGRVTKDYYSKLADGRRVHLSYPKYESGTPTFHGPVRYTVTNLAGKVEAQATVAISGNTTTSALTAHIDETDSDPILAADLGAVSALTTFIYGDTGTQLEEERLYYDIPSSGAGADGTNYDPTLYGYDDAGRLVRTKHAHGTIYRRAYDLFDRMLTSSVGTIDPEETGTDNMFVTETIEYDGGADGGNGLLTEKTLHVDSSTDRVTDYTYDYRGRLLLIENPAAPHSLSKYDNLGRVTAAALYSDAPASSVDPSDEGTQNDRMGLDTTEYDELGRPFRSKRHKIDESNGDSVDTLVSSMWYDAEGRLVKTDGESIVKRAYDRVGRETHTFMIARHDDSGYSDADDVSGDIVMEEAQTRYDDDGTAILSAVIQRPHNDFGASPTTGALDTNDDGEDLEYTAANLKGRIQITAMWYDATRRLRSVVHYGTYSGGDFDRDSVTEPSSPSATELMTTRVYYDSGRLKLLENPREISTYYEYDDAGRTTREVRNYINGVPDVADDPDEDNAVAFAYTDGLLVTLTADLYGTSDDQVTTYTYGTTKGASSGESAIGTGHLLQEVEYPDSASASDVVTFAYNAQEEVVYKKDQAGNVFESEYDGAGRLVKYKLATIDSSFNADVKRIANGYDGLGRISKVTQYDAVSGGNVVDEVQYSYDGWGNITEFEQDRDSAVAPSGNQYVVSYDYEKAAPTGGRQAVRVDDMTLPSGNVISLEYNGGASGLHDTYLSRVTQLKDGAVVIAQYSYLGLNRVVGTELVEADVYSNAYDSSDTYTDLDDFNRVATNRWTKDAFQDFDFYRVDIAYDESSNITLVEDSIHSGFDVEYSVDAIDRVVKAKEGTWTGSAITSSTRVQEWTLDRLGNWDHAKHDWNGDSDYLDDGEYDDDRTHNRVNELTGRNTDNTGGNEYDLVYDAVGNLVDDDEDYTYKYDPLGRLCSIRTTGTPTLTVVNFRYNGLGHRIGAQYDSVLPRGVDSSDPWTYYAYDPSWRMIAEFEGAGTDALSEYTYHYAGRDGGGNASYVDTVVSRDRDTDGNGSLDERLYYCQNWRADVSAIVDELGGVVEWVKYSAYGIPFGLPAGDTDSDGDCDQGDVDQIQAWLDNVPVSYDVRGDLNLSGSLTSGDKAAAEAGLVELGIGALSAVDNNLAWGGLEFSQVVKPAGGLYGVRMRTLLVGLGRWSRRDFLGYGDGANLYAYVGGQPLVFLDPTGLKSCAAADIELDCPTSSAGTNDTGFYRLKVEDLKASRSPGCPSGVPCRWKFSFTVKLMRRSGWDWNPVAGGDRVWGRYGVSPKWETDCGRLVRARNARSATVRGEQSAGCGLKAECAVKVFRAIRRRHFWYNPSSWSFLPQYTTTPVKCTLRFDCLNPLNVNAVQRSREMQGPRSEAQRHLLWSVRRVALD